jgi:hypothetical protein
LRAYKQKFNPVWTPRYLAYPGGLTLPRILVDASALIAGGYRSIFKTSTRARGGMREVCVVTQRISLGGSGKAAPRPGFSA